MPGKNKSDQTNEILELPVRRPGIGGLWFGPALMAVVVCLLVGGLIWSVYQRTFNLRRAKLDEDAEQLSGALALYLNGDLHYLQLLASEIARGALDEHSFRERASQFVADHPGLVNINRADAEFVIRWAAPYEPNKQVIGLKLSLPEPERASRMAHTTGGPVYTRPFEIIQGGAAFEVYAPIFRGDRFLGTVAGVYSIEKFLEDAIPGALRKYNHIEFIGIGGDVLERLPPVGSVDHRLVRQVALDPPGYGVFIRLTGYEIGVWPWWVWLLVLLSVGPAMGMAWGMIALRRDIRVRMNFEKALRALNEQLKTSIDNMPNAYILMDKNSRVIEWNRRAETIFGYTRAEMLGKDPMDYITTPVVRPKILALKEKRATSDYESSYGENANLRKDGTVIYCYWSDTVLLDRGGNMTGILAMAQDISEQKEAEARIQQQNSFLNSVIESLTHPFYVINVNDYTVELVNSSTYDGEIPAGITCHALTHHRDTPCDFLHHECPVKVITQTKEPFVTEHAHFDKEGKKTYTEVHGYPIFDADGQVEKVIEYSLDITRRKQMEEKSRKLANQLRQAQKMEAIGALAGGIAHEFNNILGAVIGYTELAAEDVPKDSTPHRNLHHVLTAAGRAREMVKQILTFSRKDEMERKPIHLGDIAKEALQLLRSTLPATIEIRSHIPEELAPVPANSTEIHQVIMNLCTNAAHALKGKEGGMIEITLDEISQGAGGSGNPGGMEIPGRRLTVRDTGHGMPPEVKERIFEPYFTTKVQGEGTGMGLAVVHGIVKRHGGEITVESEPGRGAAFHVFLPAGEVEIPVPMEPGLPITGGNERILLLDDEPLLVEMGKQMLEKLGYAVAPHTRCIEALADFREQPEAFDLVITDQTMPDMTGLQFAAELKKIRSSIPVILCTGFSESVDEESYKSKGVDAFILKPVLKKEIAPLVRAVLNGEQK